MVSLSIIVPVLNEENHLPLLLKDLSLCCCEDDEVIIVDGGSTDDGVVNAQGLVDLVMEATKGRATQMNQGASMSSGKVLWFIHADCRLDRACRMEIEKAIEAGFMWGYFDVTIGGTRRIYRIIEWFMNNRSRISRIATGDMGIFVTRELFEDTGGFPDIELMEDIALCKKIKKTKPFVSGRRLIISERRWEKHGIFKTILLMWYLRLVWFLGVPSHILAKQYDEGQ